MRDKNIDAAKGIAIVLVVMGHVCTGIPGLVKWIYSFHMPLFFLISGYLQEGKGGQFVPYLKKKASTLLYPYYVFAALETLGTVIMYIGKRDVLLQTVISRLFGINMEKNGIGAIWFLLVLFEGEILDYVINRVGKRWMVAACGVLGSIFAILQLKLPFMLHLSFTTVAFIYLGRQLKRHYMNSKNVGNKQCIVITCLLAINIVSMNMNVNTEMYTFQFGNIILFWIESLSGSLGCMMLILWIGQRYSWKWMNAIGKESLIIMAVHLYVHMITCIVVDKLLGVSSSSLLCNGIIDILWSCIMVVLSYIIAMIIRRFFPVLIKPVRLMKKE